MVAERREQRVAAQSTGPAWQGRQGRPAARASGPPAPCAPAARRGTGGKAEAKLGSQTCLPGCRERPFLPISPYSARASPCSLWPVHQTRGAGGKRQRGALVALPWVGCGQQPTSPVQTSPVRGGDASSPSYLTSRKTTATRSRRGRRMHRVNKNWGVFSSSYCSCFMFWCLPCYKSHGGEQKIRFMV